MLFFFFNDTATTEIYTLSLHDALPIWGVGRDRRIRGMLHPDLDRAGDRVRHGPGVAPARRPAGQPGGDDHRVGEEPVLRILQIYRRDRPSAGRTPGDRLDLSHAPDISPHR